MAFQHNTFHAPHQPLAVCTNCGKSGHAYRFCLDPVSSYGVLIFRWVGSSPSWTPQKEFCRDSRNSIGLVGLHAEVLMIQRKDSLGFMDIMRGKYKLLEPEYIQKQLHGMTESERNRLLNDDFDKIWHDLWGGDMESSQRYAHDRVNSKAKLSELRAGFTLPSGKKYCLADLLRQEPVVYTTPEWGFPKGRRDPYETDIQCAYRELHEETSIEEEDLWKVVNVAPFKEIFYGSNDIHYRHTYYLAQYIGQKTISYDALNPEMTREIGNIAWKGFDEALMLLRPDNVEKRAILLQLASLLRNFVPIFYEEMVSSPLSTSIAEGENHQQEQQTQYVFTASGPSRLSGHTERLSKSRRFFGERQTFRRISNIRGGSERTNLQDGSASQNGAERGDGIRPRGRGRFISGYRRQNFSEQTSEKERVQGESPTKDN